MDLTPKQQEELHTAICDAFTESELTQAIRHRFGDVLQNLVQPGPFKNVAFELISVYQRQGAIDKLIEMIREERPRNQCVQRFLKGLGDAYIPPQGAAVEEPVNQPAIGRLRPKTAILTALKAVPALKYALAVLGIVSAIAIIKSFGVDFRVAVLGTILMVALMVASVVFATLTKVKSPHVRWTALVMMWAFLSLTILTATLLFTSAFFSYPKPLADILPSKNPKTVYPPDPDTGKGSGAPPGPEMVAVTVPLIKQEQSNWSAIAVLQMIEAGYGHKELKTQADWSKKLHGQVVNNTLSEEELIQALKDAGLKVTVLRRALTQDELASAVPSSQRVVCGFSLKPTGGKHLAIVAGWERSADGRLYIVHDPSLGRGRFTYAGLVSAYNKGEWDLSLIIDQ